MEIPRHWRLKKERYGLVGGICSHCDNKMFPQRDVCLNCGDQVNEPFTFKGKGEVYSHTTVYEAPAGHEDNAPYVVALVKLDEGPMITAQLTDLTTHEEIQIVEGEEEKTRVFDVEIGDEVEMVTRKIKNDGNERGLIIYSYKFRSIFTSSMEVSKSSK